MQTASANIWERMGRSQELGEFQRGTVIGCHLCNTSSRGISLQTSCGLHINKGGRWRSGLSRRPIYRGYSPRYESRTGRPPVSSHHYPIKGQKKNNNNKKKDQGQCVESFMEWVSMAEQLDPSHRSPIVMQSVGCHWTLQQ